MTEIINLRQHRKAKGRSEKEKKAAENRRIHGRTKAQKQKEAAVITRSQRHLEGHKREKSDEEE